MRIDKHHVLNFVSTKPMFTKATEIPVDYLKRIFQATKLNYCFLVLKAVILQIQKIRNRPPVKVIQRLWIYFFRLSKDILTIWQKNPFAWGFFWLSPCCYRWVFFPSQDADKLVNYSLAIQAFTFKIHIKENNLSELNVLRGDTEDAVVSAWDGRQAPVFWHKEMNPLLLLFSFSFSFLWILLTAGYASTYFYVYLFLQDSNFQHLCQIKTILQTNLVSTNST